MQAMPANTWPKLLTLDPSYLDGAERHRCNKRRDQAKTRLVNLRQEGIIGKKRKVCRAESLG